MTTERKTYAMKTALYLVDRSVQYGISVPKVEELYANSKEQARYSANTAFQDGTPEWKAAYFAALYSIFLRKLEKYASKMSQETRQEIRDVVKMHYVYNVERLAGLK